MRRQILLLVLSLLVLAPNASADVLLNYMPPGTIWGPGSDAPHACKVWGGTVEEQYAIKYIAEGNSHTTKVSYYAEEQTNYGSAFYAYMNVIHGGTSPSNGTLIATSANVDVNAWGTGPAFHGFDFSSGFPMVYGDTYWFVVRAYTSISTTSCGSGPNLRSYATIETSHVKTDAYYSTDAGSTWTLDYDTTLEAPLKIEGLPSFYLNFPLLTNNGVSGYHFDDAWTIPDTKCSETNEWQRHTGVDYDANYTDEIYASAPGVVKLVDWVTTWHSYIVIEHTLPNNDKYTTVYWHVDPLVSVNDTVDENDQIATVTDLGGNSHFHFGIRIGAYTSPTSSRGALPVTTCDGKPAFPSQFIDPEDTTRVIFH